MFTLTSKEELDEALRSLYVRMDNNLHYKKLTRKKKKIGFELALCSLFVFISGIVFWNRLLLFFLRMYLWVIGITAVKALFVTAVKAIFIHISKSYNGGENLSCIFAIYISFLINEGSLYRYRSPSNTVHLFLKYQS